ncbi:MAG: DUF4127 family protein [Candidatus Sericytochromatia bacterium]|uniref:DUF4127 family protein n=1 Tax=Candidatus Tanganyikabacteria bacterium TaxID=2961651 RepID=A0A937X438_9BACT|nr:DUF4127 family protein [Candidatus Tanganyikabacteria bacterium]
MSFSSGALALIPLDARPCTRAFPAAIGRIGGLDVRIPPPELLGDLERVAPIDELFDWLEAQARVVDAAVVALDTLVYGGLIPARRSTEPIDTLLARLARVRDLPIASLYAFSVTMRISNSDVAEEEKPYWSEYGPTIYQWSFFSDKFDRTREPEAARLAQAARKSIPDAIAEDYLATRRRNYAINLKELELAEEGRFRVLCLTQDDTSPYGFNQAEKRQMEARGIPNVLIYPGADEVASCLVGRCLNEREGKVPVFRIRSFPESGGDLVAMYEDRPMRSTAAGQIHAAGGRMPHEGEAADLEILLNTPASGQGDLALRIDMEKVDTPPRDLAPLVERLNTGLPAAFADIAYANGADPLLWERLAGGFRPEGVAAFGAWNTAGNTLGTVVATASAYLTGPRDGAAHRQFILDRLADDFLYQSVLRPQLQQEARPIVQVEADLGNRLAALWQARLPHLPINGISARLPWGRLFEADITVAAAD